MTEAEGVAKKAEEELAVAKERLLLQENELQSKSGTCTGQINELNKLIEFILKCAFLFFNITIPFFTQLFMGLVDHIY